MGFSLKRISTFSAFLSLLSLCPLAFSSPWGNAKLELGVEFGPNYLQLGNSFYQVTETETDNLRQTHNPAVGQFSFGLGYFFPFSHQISSTADWRWFSGVRAALNLRHFEHYFFDNEIIGQIEQYQDPTMNNYRYGIAITNTRLMLDVALNIATVKKLSLFVIAGVGPTWTKLRYDDRPVLGIEAGALSLDSYRKSDVTTEEGIGITYEVKDNINLSLQYLYTDFGTVRTANTGYLDGEYTVIGPARFHLRSQGVSLGLRINL